ncbi:MAG: hypothetical protein KUG57_08220 [Ilumatobacteraceae bacterium]|nr:hypothetical protein [Ilumatobacteraceae bacterium]
MPLTAKFVPNSTVLSPSAQTELALHVSNLEPTQQLVQLISSGDLTDHVVLASDSITLEPGETFVVPVTIDPGPTLAAGTHSPTIELTADVGNTSATAKVEVMAFADHSVALVPEQSKSPSSGRHVIEVGNLGNVPVTVELLADSLESEISLDVDTPITVTPGEMGEVAVRATPIAKFWNGPSRNHDFIVRTTGSDGRTAELPGIYEQRPRIPAWLGPAALGAFTALLIGAVIWVAWLQPWVRDTADDAAAEAIELDRLAMEERIEELEAAAAEAEELPLGRPTDLRLVASPAGGNAASDSDTVRRAMTLSVTDIVFQNPTGAVGTVTLLRDDDILLESELANFRDLDLHFVAPFVFDESSEVTLLVDCLTPGPGQSECTVGASLVGFIDEAD